MSEAQSDYDANYDRQLSKTYVDGETIDSTYSKHLALSASKQAQAEACGE